MTIDERIEASKRLTDEALRLTNVAEATLIALQGLTSIGAPESVIKAARHIGHYLKARLDIASEQLDEHHRSWDDE